MNKIVYILAAMSCAGCVNSGPQQPAPLPDSEVAVFREAALKMSEYIVLEDSAYRLTIDKEKALRLGVPEKYYHRMKQELEYTNYLVREEYNKKGIPIEMPEYKIDTITGNTPDEQEQNMPQSSIERAARR